MDSETLALFHERMDRLISLDKHSGRLAAVVAPAALQAAETYYGGSAGVIRHLLQFHQDMKLTPEDIAEFEEMEREENERLVADFTPNLENPMYNDTDWLAHWLLSAAMDSDEEFDEVFENIMIHRYDKSVMTTQDGETGVYRKVKTLDEFESIITGI